jgi:hypothetical protein
VPVVTGEVAEGGADLCGPRQWGHAPITITKITEIPNAIVLKIDITVTHPIADTDYSQLIDL